MIETIRTIIVDDQALIRDGLKTILALEKDITIVGTAKNGVEAVKLARELKPDIMLMDIRMPEMNGVEAVTQIHEFDPDIKVIMLTTFNDEEYIIDALVGGASGYLLKDMEIEALTATIRDAAGGRMILPPEVAGKLAAGLGRLSRKRQTESEFLQRLGLSEREKEIASMMVQGFTNKQIATALFITEGTVRNYISGIYSKLDVADRTKAVLLLKENGIE